LNLGENQNSIVTLVTYKNTKVFLASDMILKDDRVIKDYLGKIDVLKLAHHGYSESSCEFLSTTKPDFVVISYTHIHDYSLINYMKDNFNPKIYLTQNVPGTTENIELSAIKLHFLNG
jgi:beta-lactamase superfamily II metal-dependent hydrolase